MVVWMEFLVGSEKVVSGMENLWCLVCFCLEESSKMGLGVDWGEDCGVLMLGVNRVGVGIGD